MSPNIARTTSSRLLAIVMVIAVHVSTAGCKASGHVDFEIDIPALELEIQPPDRSPEP